jgi:hypothetical protein
MDAITKCDATPLTGVQRVESHLQCPSKGRLCCAVDMHVSGKGLSGGADKIPTALRANSGGV